MESNRLNIAVEKPPMVIFRHSGNSFASSLEIKDRGQADVEFEVIGQRVEPDENGNEVVKYTLKIIKAIKVEPNTSRK